MHHENKLLEEGEGTCRRPIWSCQQSICYIKTEGELSSHKTWWIEKVPSRKKWVRPLERAVSIF